jgi:hypothetical protein
MTFGRLVGALCLASSLLALSVATANAAGDPASAGAPPVAAAAAARNPDVQPEALAALSRMSAYLRSLQSFRAHGDTVREEVDERGQKLQFMGTVTYRVKKPDGFAVEFAEDRRVRQLFYDGKSLTLFSPRMGYYATVAAPPTIRQTLDVLSDKYGVHFPLEDLFVWGTDKDWHEDLATGYWVGYAHINGQDADQYAFRQQSVDWQIWIARGDKPVPLRVAITGSDDPALPQFEANMTWETGPEFAADTFAFKPPSGAVPIQIKAAGQ